MSLNEVNWRNVFSDHKSFPPDVEFLVTNQDSSRSVLQQKFLCHKLLLAAVSPVFQSQFFGEGAARLDSEILVVVVNDCNPAAFQKMLEFIYFQKPFKLNSTRQVSDTEGISLVMDTMLLAVNFKLRKLVSFCEETTNKTVVVTSQNYKEVQKIMMMHKELGEIHRDFCEKFGSVVFTILSRDRQDIDPVEKREIVESEVELFRQGHPSKVMDNKRTKIPESEPMEPPVIKMVNKSEDVVILQAAPTPTNLARSDVTPGSSTTFHSVPRASTSSPLRTPVHSNLMQLPTPGPVLGPFPSPVPTSIQSETLCSPLLSSPGFPSLPEDVSSLTLFDLWKPRSSSTPVPVEISTKMLQNILTSVSGVKEKSIDALVLTKEELKTLVLKFKDLSEPEKQELFEYVKVMQVKDPELIKCVRNEIRRENL